MADASAAVHISRNRFLVVSDESNVFQIFDATHTGRFLQQIPISKVTDIKSEDGEADLEASAKVGDVTFWVSSHSRDNDGNLMLDRHRLFATIIKGKKQVKIKQLGKSYVDLAHDLVTSSPLAQWTDEELVDQPAPHLVKSERALNIEGLTSFNGGIAVGFRSPLADSHAILLPVLNPLEMVMFGSRAHFGEPILLDLDGRGIRSIDYWPQRKCYLISANKVDQTAAPAYYLWNGKRDAKPKLLHLPPHASEVSPEGVVFLSRRRILILSDDGSKQKNKPNRKKKFRSVLVKVS
jgi:hypothetical protein